MDYKNLLIPAIITISLALVFYSIGTWAERIQRKLKLWHIFFFILGLTFDITSTSLMRHIAAIKKISNSLHEITGMLAIVLMAIHAAWAIWTYWKGSYKAKVNFSKFSVLVWAFWLIPYLIGVVIGMSN